MTLCALAIVLTLASPEAAQTRAKASADPDMREMAAYALTMDTLQKVDRAMRAMAAELKKDPRFAEQAKIKSELEALKKKDELSEADEKRGEQLAAKLEALESNTDMNRFPRGPIRPTSPS